MHFVFCYLFDGRHMVCLELSIQNSIHSSEHHPQTMQESFKPNQQIIETWPKICPNLTSAIFSPANAAVGQLPPLAASGTWRFGHLWSTAEEAVGDLKRCPVPRQKLPTRSRVFRGNFSWGKNSEVLDDFTRVLVAAICIKLPLSCFIFWLVSQSPSYPVVVLP